MNIVRNNNQVSEFQLGEYNHINECEPEQSINVFGWRKLRDGEFYYFSNFSLKLVFCESVFAKENKFMAEQEHVFNFKYFNVDTDKKLFIKQII